MENEIINIKTAKERGLRFYYLGKECKDCGYKSKRYVKGAKCAFCKLKDPVYDSSFTDCTVIPKRRDEVFREYNYTKFLETKQANCKVHAVHGEWEIYNKYVICKKCKSERNKAYRLKYPIKYLFTQCQTRGFEVTITEQDIENKLKEQNNKCALTDVTFDEEFRPSLDRIDSSIGYIVGNIQLVLHEINTMKSNFKEERFVELCKLVSNFHAV